MRVFVLTAGRTGSVTFSKACQHIRNYSAGHETRARIYGPARFDYADQHIEVDNRLSWFLGVLDERFDPAETFYVHLERDEEAVAASFAKRWQYAWRSGVIEAFAHALVMRPQDYAQEERLDVCRFYVQTVNANIRLFLRNKPNQMSVQTESAREGFPHFWSQIAAEGSLSSALAEWDTAYNAS